MAVSARVWALLGSVALGCVVLARAEPPARSPAANGPGNSDAAHSEVADSFVTNTQTPEPPPLEPSACDSAMEPPADGPQIMFPLPESILLSGRFDVVCKAKPGDALRVNGRQQDWGPFEAPARAARVGLPPGIHEIAVGDEAFEICVALNEEEHDAPSDWQFAYKHAMEPGDKRCDDCHHVDRREGNVSVGQWKGYKSCLACHTPIEFEATHAHPLEPLQPCQMCHAVHGSKRDGLLKGPIKKLCKDCHDS